MKLPDICPRGTWGVLETELFEKYNFQGSVFTSDGMRITSVKNFSNKLCPAVKADEKGRTFIGPTCGGGMRCRADQTGGPYCL